MRYSDSRVVFICAVICTVVCAQTTVYAQTGTWTTPAESSAFSSHASYPHTNAWDDENGTRWQAGASGSSWIQVGLGESQSVCGWRANGYSTYTRLTKLEVSSDGSSWSTVWTGDQTLTNGAWNEWSWTCANARYVKASVTGGTGAATLREIDMDVAPPTPTPTATATATPTATATATATPTATPPSADASCATIAAAVAQLSGVTPAPPTLTPTPAPTATCPACPKESGCASCCLHARDAAFMAACLTTFEEVKCYEIMKLLGPP